MSDSEGSVLLPCVEHKLEEDGGTVLLYGDMKLLNRKGPDL